MEKNGHYLSGSFDGLSDGGEHYFKSSFAKSMALETTKSLNFDLDMTGNDPYYRQNRYNTIGSQRVNTKYLLYIITTYFSHRGINICIDALLKVKTRAVTK